MQTNTPPINTGSYTNDQLNNMAKLGVSSPSTTALSNTQINTTPSATDLSNVNPYNVSDSPSSSAKSALSIQGITSGLFNSQAKLQQDAQNNVDTAKENYDSTGSALSDLIGNYLGKGDAQLQAEKNANIPQLRTMANDLSVQYQTQQEAYNNNYKAIFSRPGITSDQAAQEIRDLNNVDSLNQANLGIRQAIAMNQYQTAQALVDHQIDLKYSPMKDAITFGMQFLANNKDILTQAQQNQLTTNLSVQNQQYTNAVYNEHLIKDTQAQMMRDAAAQGAPSDVIAGIQAGKTIGESAQAGGQYLKNGNYTITQTGIDQGTGLPIYSRFNPKTGTLEPLNYNGALGATGSDETVVNGYQMGATTTLGAYASATSTQVANIKGTVTKIQSTVGNITDSETAQAAINTISPKSPITGDMVMKAATQYGIDPSVLIGVMQAETKLGTDGSKGATQGNYGNVGNTDSVMASGKSVAMKPQDGVNAVAKNLAMRQVQPGQNDPAQAAANQNLTPVQKAGMIIKAAPALLQPAMNYTATGDVYIDSSKVPTNLDVMKQSYASKTGIPVLSAEQASVVKGADEAARNITDVIAPAWKDIAPNNLLEKGLNKGTEGFSKALDTDFFAKNKTFSANKENLAQQIKALSQSAPKLGLLSTAESALPSNEGYASWNPFASYDSLKDGNMKMQRTLDLLNQTIKTYLPNAAPVQLNTAPVQAPQTMVANGVTYAVGADGKYYPNK